MTASPTPGLPPSPLPESPAPLTEGPETEGPDPDVLALLLLELGARPAPAPLAPSATSPLTAPLAPARPVGLTRAEEDALLAGPGAVLLAPSVGPGTGSGAGPGADRDGAGPTVAEIRALAPDVLVVAPADGGADAAEVLDGGCAPSAAAIGAVDDVDATRALGDALGDVLAAAGVELLLGPVLDVAAGPEPAVSVRSFGEDPDLVARHARALAGGIRDAGVAVCGLHLPGIGALPERPDSPVPAIGLRRDLLEASALVPWELTPWLDAVMTAPVAAPALGEGLASLEPWSAELLDELGHGAYRGLVISGDLARSAALLAGGPPPPAALGAAAARAIRAGAHLIAVGGASSLVAVHNAIVAEIDAGRLDGALVHERAEETRGRIEALRARRRWLPTPEAAPALTVLAHRGAILARRAVRPRQAALDLRPTAILDLRDGDEGRDAIAALAGALREQGIRTDSHGYAHDALRAEQLLLITRRGRASALETARLQEIGRSRRDGILVHTGTASTAPEAERLVLARGSGAAAMRAVVAALRESR
ncbi:glycoside hydrolase family 3 N-terminal domain-containing protein [Brachybacterium sp. DNPG3]